MRVVRRQGLPTETTIQAAVTIRVCPFASILERRSLRILNLQTQFASEALVERPGTRFLSRYIWIPGLGDGAYITPRGAPLFLDDFETSNIHEARRGNALLGFSSFSGRVARLPDGYYVVWTTHGEAEDANAHPLAKTLRRSGSTDRLSVEECQDVLRRTYAYANRGVRFLGISLDSFNAKAMGQDEAGIAALVSGRVTLENTSDQILLKDDLVTWEMPGLGDVVYKFNGNDNDARPRLKLYVAGDAVRLSLREGFRRLLFRPQRTGPTDMVIEMPTIHLWRKTTIGAAPPAPLPAKEELAMLEHEMGSNTGQKLSLQLIHCIEALMINLKTGTDLLPTGAQRPIADAALGGLPSIQDSHGTRINLVRAVMSMALGLLPPDSAGGSSLVTAVPPEFRSDAALAPVREAFGGLFGTIAEISPGFAMTSGAGVPQPFAKVVVGARRNEELDVLLLN